LDKSVTGPTYETGRHQRSCGTRREIFLGGRPLVLIGDELDLSRSAHRAVPSVGNVFERSAGGDAAVRVALFRVIDEAAGFAHPFQRRCFTHGRQIRPVARQITCRKMADERAPAPGEELNEGEPTKPRMAATVILLRGGSEKLELLLVQRNPDARFMGGAWVFPGGAVDAHEGDGDASLRAAAVREVEEEASVVLPDQNALVAYSRWITPKFVKTRFDTWFFLAPIPEGAEPRVDGNECVDLRWETPQSALDAWRADELMLVFPTIKHLEQISVFDSADALLAHAANLDVQPVEPRIEIEGEIARVLLPGEPGYDDL